MTERGESLAADEICWTPTSARWPSSSPLIRLAIEVLPGIEDETTATLVEELGMLVEDRDEQIRAMGEVQSVSLDELHTAWRENARLRDVVIELREQRRGPSTGPETTEGN